MKNNGQQRIPFYQVDAFSNGPFTGNPAAVCLLDAWPDDKVLQRIATENNLSETGFVIKQGNDFALRWFTPAVEVDLCGHATLAAASVPVCLAPLFFCHVLMAATVRSPGSPLIAPL